MQAQLIKIVFISREKTKDEVYDTRLCELLCDACLYITPQILWNQSENDFRLDNNETWVDDDVVGLDGLAAKIEIKYWHESSWDTT